MIYLETTRLIIRDPKQSDLIDSHELMSNPKTMYYLNDLLTHSLEETQANLNLSISEIDNENRTMYFLIITLKDTNEFVGQIGYNLIEKQIAHMGYFILPKYHNKGYTTEALKEVIRFAFTDNDVYRIQTGCFSQNKGSERVMQKCGMIKESHKKECTWHDGVLKDRVKYRLLKHEWEQGLKNDDYFSAIQKLVDENEIIIDRKKGSTHPKYNHTVYPIDYGYIKDTTSVADGDGIDVWCGSCGSYVSGVICTVDLLKKDSEIKILIGCSHEEKQLIYDFHNDSENMKGILIHR